MTDRPTEYEALRVLAELLEEQAREIARPMTERSSTFASWQDRMNATLPLYRTLRGVRVGDRVAVHEGLAKTEGRPLAEVRRVAEKTAVVFVFYLKREIRVPLGGLVVDAGELLAEARAFELELEAPAESDPAELPVVVIPCGGRKAATPAPAAELYEGSYFRAALAAARATTTEDRIRVLSGRYGFVRLDEVLEPYEQRIDAPGAVDDAQSERQVAGDELLRRVRAGELEAVILAGASYAARARVLGPAATVPAAIETARGIGDHLRYFAGVTRQAAERAELEELAERIPAPAAVEPARCDVCQSEPALVTIGAVDYCARCAPDPLEAFVADAVEAALEAVIVARCECSPRGLEPVFTDPEIDGRCRRCGAFVEYVPIETADELLVEHGIAR